MAQRDTNRVLARRKELGLDLKTVASRAKRSVALISMVEGGYVGKRATLESIAAALETEPWRLWPDEFEDAEEPSVGDVVYQSSDDAEA